MPSLENSIGTFLMIFKHFGDIEISENLFRKQILLLKKH